MNLVEEVIGMLGIRKYRISSSGNYVMSCPFARWTHSDGDDRHPSFAMKPFGYDDFLFNCFACGLKGNSYKFYRYASQYGILNVSRGLRYTPKSFEEVYFGKAVEADMKLEGVNYDEIKDVLMRYHDYLDRRGISEEVAMRFRLGYDERKDAIVFPAISVESEIVGWSYRLVGVKRYIHSVGFPRGKFLYGEHLIGSSGDCVVVEGFFDVLKVFQAGYQVVGLLGTVCTKTQMTRLLNMLPVDPNGRIVVFFDGDAAGTIAAHKFFEQYSSLYKIVVIKDLVGLDPSDLSEEAINDILKKYEVVGRNEAEGGQV